MQLCCLAVATRKYNFFQFNKSKKCVCTFDGIFNIIWHRVSKSVNEIKSNFLGGFKSNNNECTCVPGMLGDSPLYVERWWCLIPSNVLCGLWRCSRSTFPSVSSVPFVPSLDTCVSISEQTMRFTYLIG